MSTPEPTHATTASRSTGPHPIDHPHPSAPPWPTTSPAAARVVSDSLETARRAAEVASDHTTQTTERLVRLTEQLHEIHITLERLRGSLDALTAHAGDHETRIRRLEQWQQRMNPVLGLITLLLGAILTSLLNVWIPR